MECAKCRRIRRKFLDVAMGPISDVQLTIAPGFYTAFLDLDGPITVYVPGFERQTRNRKSIAVKNWTMTCGCPVTCVCAYSAGRQANQIKGGCSFIGQTSPRVPQYVAV